MAKAKKAPYVYAQETGGVGGPKILGDPPASAGDDATHARRLARIGFALVVVWLLFLVFPAVGLYEMRSDPARLVPAAAGIAVFVVLYVWAAWRAVRAVLGTGVPLGQTVLRMVLTVLTLLGSVLPLAYGDNWSGSLVFVGILAGLTLRFRTVAAVSVVLALLTVVPAIAAGVGWGPAVSITINAGLSGLLTFGARWLVATNAELRTARAKVARLAVAEERLRFARDLHDLLGHSLSLIALKSELAGRLAEASPNRATQEIADVERVAREALREVREAVAGYRRPTLDAELDGAREMLRAAGLDCEVEHATGALSPATGAVLAWTVREGVTNVIRHSRARRCEIRVTRESGTIGAEITDDGHGVQGEPTPKTGSGLSGLAERVAAGGGRFEAGPLPVGGFRLRVELPVFEGANPGAPARDGEPQ